MASEDRVGYESPEDGLRRYVREALDTPEAIASFKQLILTGKAKRLEIQFWKYFLIGRGPAWLREFLVSEPYCVNVKARFDSGRAKHLAGVVRIAEVDCWPPVQPHELVWQNTVARISIAARRQ